MTILEQPRPRPAANDQSLPGGVRISDLEKCLLPFKDARVLPTHCYTDPDFYKFEVDNLLMRQWLYAGRIDQVEKAGDYFTLSRLGETVIVMRDFKDRLRCFSAACRHRGYPVAQGSGNCGKRGFTCPYHGWRYRVDGSLAAAPFMQDGYETNGTGLPEFGIDVWQGFIFINFDRTAQPISQQLSTLDEAMAPYRLAEMRCSTMREKPLWSGNWKATLDNFTEAYHQPFVHPTTFEPMAPARFGIYEDVDGPYNLFWLPAPKGDIELAFDAIEGLPERHSTSFCVVNIFPMFHMLIDPSCVVLLDMAPLSVNELHARWDVLVTPETFARPDFAERRDWLTKALIPTWDEDEHACDTVRHGQSSRFTEQGNFSWMEKSVHQLHKWLAERYIEAVA